MKTLSDCALDVLNTAEPKSKAEKTKAYVEQWRAGKIPSVGLVTLPDRPQRPNTPELLPPADMPKRGKAGSKKNRIALLHAIAHIELNAIDLAWDIIGRFAHYSEDNGAKGFYLPKAFYDAWAGVAYDEAKHHMMVEVRLNDFGVSYGDLPAHDGLWEASLETKDDFAARLAIVPMVLEARGLDVTPMMVANMQRFEDFETADILQVIHDEEISHVEAGTTWFKAWCDYHGLDVETHCQSLVKKYFKGVLKRPFNDPSRMKAGMIPDWYEPLADNEFMKDVP